MKIIDKKRSFEIEAGDMEMGKVYKREGSGQIYIRAQEAVTGVAVALCVNSSMYSRLEHMSTNARFKEVDAELIVSDK